MNEQQLLNYDRIATAIEYLKTHYQEQPSLEDAAAHVHLSPFHFQRMFQDWAGVSPKQFLQFMSLQHARHLLKDQQATLLDTAIETGLSGTSRLHDLFLKVEGMTPGEYKNGGQSLVIHYSFAETPFGEIIVASTPKGICHMAFADQGRDQAFAELKSQFPHARYIQLVDQAQQNALFIFGQDWSKLDHIKLHLKGSPFQIRVWETLLRVPMGGLTTYSGLADAIGQPKAARAVGSAVGANPVAFLIPCHRVIRSSGETGQYHWGSLRKEMILGWEAAKTAAPRN
jgi:AraC family transcriptional regulator, regulatory protein of adaptative response / methylated-DNA-[protein]-cysteine methyltransferase